MGLGQKLIKFEFINFEFSFQSYDVLSFAYFFKVGFEKIQFFEFLIVKISIKFSISDQRSIK